MMRSLFKKAVLIGGLCAVAGIGVYYYVTRTHQTHELHGIIDFDYDRDHAFIEKLFEKDMYWLVDESIKNFSADFMMKNFTISAGRPDTKGQLTIKMLYEHGKPVGFTAYYMESFYLGRIRFIAVDENFRSKGYGKQLTDYAVEQLKSRGAVKIAMWTRINNIPAQKAYFARGFKIVDDDGKGFVLFEKVLR